MVMLRYCWWLLVYHFTTCFRQNPWAFMVGTLLSPYYLISRLSHPVNTYNTTVLRGIAILRDYWQKQEAILPPEFVKKRFLALENDLRRSE